MARTNAELAAIFQQMADLIEITGGNRFKANAFAKAARTIKDLPGELAGEDRAAIKAIPGIGAGTADRIGEYLDTGRVQEHQALLDAAPRGLLALLEVPGLGPKTVAQFWREGGVTDVPTLQKKLADGSLASLKGMGAKKLENLRQSLAFAQTAGERVRLGRALPLARWLTEQLEGLPGVRRAAFAGSVRRGKETIGDIDLLVAADPDRGEAIGEALAQLGVVEKTLMHGPTKTSVRTDEGVQVDLRVVEDEAFGAALLYFTGSKEHNIRLRERAIARGLRLSEYGLFEHPGGETGRRVAGETEASVYAALGLAWVPPELREDRGELALAEADDLPKLIEVGDIRAELHAHTTASDGRWSIHELASAAAERGFHTVAVTDHSKGQVQANGLDAGRLERHIEAVRAVAAELKGTIAVLAGSEVDILADGKLDYPDSLLRELDVVVASPHAALSQDPAKATARLLRAIENRYVTILGHPTGRLIGRRPGLAPDMNKLIAAAADRGIALELNANAMRLDLRDTHARAAIDAGVKLAINTDAHGPADFDQLTFGVRTARRAGATAKDVINCLDRKGLARWLASTRP